MRIFCLFLSALAMLSGPRPASAGASAEALVAAALERTRHHVVYDGSYRRIAYPMGNVAADRGVCSDLVIRSYRAIGIDLQRLLHRDMRRHFAAYPKHWGLRRPDRNIDHRRVPNLRRFLHRRRAARRLSRRPEDYRPGDLVSWMLAGNLPHMGIVVDGRSADGKRPLIVHNIGGGPELEDFLFQAPITGHYRYLPK